MKYDNPKIRDIIDDCIKKILTDADEEFLRYVNTAGRWELRISEELYKALVPSNCFSSLQPAIRYMGEKCGCFNFSILTNSDRYGLPMRNTSWMFSIEDGHIEGKYTMSLDTQDGRYVVAYDKHIPAGVILAIDYHFPYIQEKVPILIRETEKRRLLQRIKKCASV